MKISIELEQLKTDFLEDLKKRFFKGETPSNDNIKDFYKQYFYDFEEDFSFEEYKIWISANIGIDVDR